jgi:hypothetical protein
MILNDKQDCIESIARILEQTSAWRRKTAAKFPGDERNTKAAEMLDQLATDAAKLNDDHPTRTDRTSVYTCPFVRWCDSAS